MMDFDEIASSYDCEMMRIDGFDDCCIGVAERFGMEPVFAYDREKIIAKLEKDMSRQNAEEFFEFNIAGAWVGTGTPVFVERMA